MRAALWDMDGTLVDTAHEHELAWRETCRELGREFTTADFAATFGRRNEETIGMLWPGRFDVAGAQAVARKKEEMYRAMAARGVSLLEGAGALLAGLHLAGWRQAIGSSAPRENIALIVEKTGIHKFLGAIVTGDDVTKGKPEPEVFLAGAARLGVPAAGCVVFEDAPVGVLAAKAAGMKCVGVLLRSHHKRDDLLAAGADVVVDDLTAVNVAALETLLLSSRP